MTPNTHPHIYAMFDSASELGALVPVIGWDDTGRALIPDPRTGNLRPADSYGDLRGVFPFPAHYNAERNAADA